MILTITLNAAVDRTLVVPSLTLGHRHRASESVTLAGGKSINVARGLRTLGVPVLATGFVGGRNGDAIRDGLSEAAIPFDLVEIEQHSRTSTAIIDPMAGTQTEINEYGPEVSPAEAQEFSRRLEHLMEFATAVVFAGSLPPNLEEGFLVRLVQRSRERGLYTVVDSTPSVLRMVLKAGPSLVSPNQHEAESVVGFDFIEGEDFPRGAPRRALAPGSRAGRRRAPGGRVRRRERRGFGGRPVRGSPGRGARRIRADRPPLRQFPGEPGVARPRTDSSRPHPKRDPSGMLEYRDLETRVRATEVFRVWRFSRELTQSSRATFFNRRSRS